DNQRMHDVLLLLESLAIREEVTVRLILGHLYDIGARNFIDYKISYRPFNKVLNWIAKYTKPVALIVGVRWFKRNAPELIADWMYSLVVFEEEGLVTESTPLGEIPPAELPPPQAKPVDFAKSTKQLSGGTGSLEVQRLRSQVRWLSGLSIGAIALIVGTLLH
ncbi:MAG: hypothetical protein AAFN08_15130, partial [Cyanobacteria bacterium J06559_3]